MFRFHRLFDQIDRCLIGVTVIISTVRDSSFELNHSQIEVFVTGRTLNCLMKSVIRGHEVRLQLWEDLADYSVGKMIEILIGLWSDPVLGRLFFQE